MRTPSRASVRALTLTLTSLTLALASCGGDSSSTGPEEETEAPISARINGVDWAGETLLSYANYNVTESLLVLYGLHTGGYSVAINLDEIDTTGEYDLHGVLPLRFAVVTLTGGEGWSTTQGEGGGTVTITSFTEDRITGTFQFTAEPNAGSGASGTLQVTSGRFDLLVNRL